MRRPAILLLAGAALLMPSSALARPRALDVFIPGGTSAIDPLQYPPEGGPGDPAFYTYGDISITRDGGQGAIYVPDSAYYSGPVTCLRVHGHTARFVIQDSTTGASLLVEVTASPRGGSQLGTSPGVTTCKGRVTRLLPVTAHILLSGHGGFGAGQPDG